MPKKTEPKTVRVRVLIAVFEDGDWDATGWGRGPTDDGIRAAAIESMKESATPAFHWSRLTSRSPSPPP